MRAPTRLAAARTRAAEGRERAELTVLTADHPSAHRLRAIGGHRLDAGLPLAG